MKKLTEKLASMHLTSWTLVFLVLWVGVGLYLAGLDSYTAYFRSMNNMLVRDWLFSEETGSGKLKIWFIMLCAAMTLLGINLIFCSWHKIYRIMKARFSGNQLFMLIVHAIFGFVALGHLGGLMLGFEYPNIRLGEGQDYSIKEGYQIKIEKIHFAGDAAVLKKGKSNITKDDMDYQKSYAEISLLKDGKLIKAGKAGLFSPMHYQDIHVTLSNFILPKDLKGSPEPGTVPWGMFTISRNPVLKSFLTVYPVMIAGIFIYLIITWRKSHLAPLNGRE